MDCVISNNTVSTNAGGRGGGMNVELRYQCLVSNCTIVGNLAPIGGGVRSFLSTGSGTSLFETCVIASNMTIPNSSYGDGGGVYHESGSFIMRNSTIENNWAMNRDGGGARLISGAFLDGCLVRGNTCSSDQGVNNVGGGGLCMYNASTIVNSTIEANSAHRAWGGGGIATSKGGFITNCVIRNNTAGSSVAANQRGGGVLLYYSGTVDRCECYGNVANGNGGGVALENGGRLLNSLVTRNVGAAGGVYTLTLVVSNGWVANCTIVSNTATGDYGGGIYASGTNFIYNCIVWSNYSATASRRDFYAYGLAGAAGSNACFACCVSIPLTNDPYNITTPPRFADWAATNYRLAADSPCVNAGTNQEWWMSAAADLDGTPRLDRLHRRVDMGAYERIAAGGLFTFR